MQNELKARIEAAHECFVRRKDRDEHPTGKFDKGGRWYPASQEEQICCSDVRSPSRSWPYSLMLHCRTAKHIAMLFDVQARDVKRGWIEPKLSRLVSLAKEPALAATDLNSDERDAIVAARKEEDHAAA